MKRVLKEFPETALNPSHPSPDGDGDQAFKDAYRRRIERAVRTFLANRETRERRARWKVGR